MYPRAPSLDAAHQFTLSIAKTRHSRCAHDKGAVGGASAGSVAVVAASWRCVVLVLGVSGALGTTKHRLFELANIEGKFVPIGSLWFCGQRCVSF